MLSAAYGYGRRKFAIANLIGRFIRYGVYAGVTFMLGKSGWIAPVAMLALACAIALWKALPWAWRKVTLTIDH